MSKKYDAVIFDFDGTLVDSMWVWLEVDHVFLKRRGLDNDKKYFENIRMLGFKEGADFTKKYFKLCESVESIVNEWLEIAIDFYSHKVPLKEGVIEYLKYLQDQGIPAAIATAGMPELVEAFFKKNKIKNYFHSITFTDEVKKDKNHPDVYLLAAKKINYPPHRILVFEDVAHGLKVAYKEGFQVRSVYEPTIPNEFDDLKEISGEPIKDYREYITKE